MPPWHVFIINAKQDEGRYEKNKKIEIVNTMDDEKS